MFLKQNGVRIMINYNSEKEKYDSVYSDELNE